MSAKYAGADRKLGRWEVRVRASDVDPKYHPVGILWPTSGNWPCDGEIDYVEKPGNSTAQVGFYNHYSCANSQTTVKRTTDWSQWHNYAVEWTTSGVVGYLDGVEWFRAEARHLRITVVLSLSPVGVSWSCWGLPRTPAVPGLTPVKPARTAS